MKPAPFEYIRPKSLAEATMALKENDWTARILAGGQSLVPMLNLRLSTVTALIDVARIPELRGATDNREAVILGSCVTHGEIEDAVVPDPARGMMRHVARHLAYRAIRNRGTIGGSVCLADPAADWLPVLLALGSSFRMANASGERTVTSESMVTGPYATAVGPSDVLTAITIPKLSSNARWGFYKVIRRAGDYPVATAAVVIDSERGVRSVVLGGGNDKAPIRMRETERELARDQNPLRVTEEALIRSVRADVVAAGRENSNYHMRLAVTTVLRAAAMAVTQ